MAFDLIKIMEFVMSLMSRLEKLDELQNKIDVKLNVKVDVFVKNQEDSDLVQSIFLTNKNEVK